MIAVPLYNAVYLWNSESGSVEELFGDTPITDDNIMVTSVKWITEGMHIAIGLSDGNVEVRINLFLNNQYQQWISFIFLTIYFEIYTSSSGLKTKKIKAVKLLIKIYKIFFIKKSVADIDCSDLMLKSQINWLIYASMLLASMLVG